MKKIKGIISVLCLVLCAVLFGSCGMGESSGYKVSESKSTASMKLLSSTADTADEVAIEERKIIKTVNETVETDDYDNFMEELDKLVKSSGGYTGNVKLYDNGYGEEGNRSASLTVYIPAENLDAFTGTVGDIGAVTYYTENIDDVTEAYVDVESRISVLEAEEKTLLAMLEKTETISDMLTVREQLTEVQSDLASYRAQKKSYDQRVAYSTVNIDVDEVEYVKEEEESFFATVGRTFMNSLDGLGTFLRYVGIALLGGAPYILFFIGVPALIVFIVIFTCRRKNKKKNNGK